MVQPRLHFPCRPGAILLPLLILLAACGGDDGTPSGPTDPPDPSPNQDPVASFSVEAAGSTAPVGAAFDASASSDPDGSVASWSWDFGDGATASGVRAEHVYDESGSFTVELTVTDDAGATATATRTVEVGERAADEVSGVVWWDRDNDGARDQGEEGVPDVPVFLDGDGDGELDADEARTVTGIGGIYRFEGLAPGSYRVTQALPVGWTNTVPGPGVTATGLPGAAPPAGPGPQRIVGGEDAPADSFPFMASMQVASQSDRRDAHFCGGTLVAPEWVMTASHCLTDDLGQRYDPSFMEVLLGTQRLEAGAGARVPVVETVINPGYTPAGGFYKRDLSLVRLGERLEDTPRAFLMDSTAFLAAVEPQDDGTLIGWGLVTETADGIPVVLQTAPIPLRPDEDCETAWNTGAEIYDTRTMLCAGPRSGTPTACRGDSGGPWMFPYRGRYHQLGVVSWGVATCGSPLGPAVYASVPAMLEFIRSTIPPEPSGAIQVTVGESGARADFGNFH